MYTGYTSDLKKRLKEHKSNRSYYTSRDNTYYLVYYEACLNQEDAMAREKYLKSGMGKRYIKNRLKQYIKGNMIPLEAKRGLV
ncbi:MAG: GIY-YIG nuclease family protein [bacterium]